MKFSSRINSFRSRPELFSAKNNMDTCDLITRMGKAEGLTHIELNYPEHFIGQDKSAIKSCIADNGLQVGGIALRYNKEFINGEFTNPDEALRNKAINITLDAAEMCKFLGGNTVTLWFGYDGYDYPFQQDYFRAYELLVSALQQVTQAHPDMQFSFEYKPYEPRTFSFIGDVSSTLMLIDDVGSPNFGITLDFCHMIMKKENPAFSLFLSARKNKLVGFHLNDGYGHFDDGLMLGSVHLMQTLEYIYYAKRVKFDGLVYFDTFPSREDPVAECAQNIRMYKKLANFIDQVGLEEMERLIRDQDAIKVQSLLLNLIN
ncbi:sugar phosphate isomerase/epimerase [Pantoea sp. At-9b]|uniref:sugar phosphate isomerase/epimerase family protein n=1 Tax=Pantoea sp. (strain At-9b) TaxID=592316 RepID=UPI0001B407B5|nr:sugar phosphate isomerase/epimerase family protein [Pantoea sp. At-9b]ADU72817.1 Xylose isomerase domain protein TIM barrel [Pantoea sp. At-9b]